MKLMGLKRLFTVVSIVSMASMLLAQPATQPADPTDPGLPENAVIRLPDGRELTLADLQRDGNVSMSWVAATSDGTTTHVTDESGRKITISDNPDGIKLTIKEGDKEPQEFQAASEEELKENHPEAYEIYEKHSHKEMMAGMRNGSLNVGGGMGFKQRIILGHGDDESETIDALGIDGSTVIDQFVLAQLGKGVRVTEVSKDSPGEKLGLQRYDLIRSVNGKPVASIEELAALLNEADRLQLEVLRVGQVVKLEEK